MSHAKQRLIPIYNSHQKATAISSTVEGPVAKIDGKWYSVNGNIQEIVDIRYPLSAQELTRFGLTND